MALILDSELRIIPDDHEIFILHPGDGKRFYNDFLANGMVFLDIPGIAFDGTPDIEDESVRRKVRMSRSIGGWHKKGRPEDKAPSRSLEDYIVTHEALESPRFIREVETLYADAKAGDLVVIPGPGYNSAVLFAEFVAEFEPDVFADVPRYGADKIPARRVRFLQTGHAKYEFGRRAIQLMQNRQAIIRVADQMERHEFYEHAYGDYSWGAVSGSYMEITESVVDQKDLADILFLTNVYGSLYNALSVGKIEHFLSLDLHEAVNEYYNRELFGDISIEVHSPGFFGRQMRNNALSAFVAAMTILAATGVAPDQAAEITVQNSVNGHVSACDLKLQTDIRETMNMVTNAHLWWDKVCKLQQASSENVGLKTKSRLVVDQAAHGN